jgi:RNA polymerase sigma-70 factor, ECF subfamily
MPVDVPAYFSKAILREIPYLRAYARLMTNDVAGTDREVEETLKRALAEMDRVSGPTDVRVQLLTILRRLLIFSERRPRNDFNVRSRISKEFYHPSLIPGEYSRSRLSLGSGLVRLDYKDREAVVLRVGMRLSHREAAQISGCEVRVYKARLCRGLVQIAELLRGKRSGMRVGKATGRIINSLCL